MRTILSFGLALCFAFVPVHAQSPLEECTVGVASGRATPDGRPLLWKNRDTGTWTSNNTVQLVDDEGLRFLALVTSKRSAWAGVNEAGFAIMNAQSRDLTGPRNDGPGNGAFMRQALGACEDVAAFRALLDRTNESGRMTHTSYGVIDAKGEASIFETAHYSYVEFDATDPAATPDGWIVRSNWARTGDGVRGGGYERCERGTRLWQDAAAQGRLDHRTVLRVHARDLADPSGTPFRLPAPQHDATLPPFSIETFSTINRHTTAATTVFHGVLEAEDPALTTMWTIIGEPICSIATPLWIAAGEPPTELSNRKGSPIRDRALELKEQIYTTLLRDGKVRRYLDTRPVLMILGDLYAVEDAIFARTAEVLDRVRADGQDAAATLAAFEAEMAREVVEGIERTTARQLALAPLRIGVWRGARTAPHREAEVLAALRIDERASPLSITAADVVAGVLGGLDVVVLVGDDGREVARELGREVVDALRAFAGRERRGVVGLGEHFELFAGEAEPVELAAASHAAPGLVDIRLSEPGAELLPELAGLDALLCRSLDAPSAPGRVLGAEVDEGRLAQCALRPEATPGMRWLLPRLARWAAQRELAGYGDDVVRPHLHTEEIVFDEQLAHATEPLLADLLDDEAEIREAAFDGLVELQAPETTTIAIGLLRDDSAAIRAAAARHLARIEHGAGLPDLHAAIALERDDTCKKALETALRDLTDLEGSEDPLWLRWFARPDTPRAVLVPGEPLSLDGPADDAATRPTGCGYDVFRVDVPARTERLTVAVHGIDGEANLDLFVKPGGFAFRGEPGVLSAENDSGTRETITIDDPAPGPWYASVECSAPVSATTVDWAWPGRAAHRPFAGVSYRVVAFTPPLAHRETVEGFYKDLFMDSGVRLTTRRDLPAADRLGLSMEYVSVTNRSATAADAEIQNRILAGNAHDPNGVLLYPDGAPRFRCVYFNGGSATNHGKSLSDDAKTRFRTFFASGGSVTGSCAGAFITSMAPGDTDPRPAYLHLWPGNTCKTGLSRTRTGHTVPQGSPLLAYADFGGDRYIGDVYHNGGCFTDSESERFWAPDTEVLLRYDYPPREMHEKVSCWAHKASDESGRLVSIGSHPESVTAGEQLELQQAILRYALDGVGAPRIKARLRSGEPRSMADNGVPGHEKIGDLQYHHFTVEVPPGTRQLVARVAADRLDHELGLFARRGDFAWHGADGTRAAGASDGSRRVLTIADPEAGRWFFGVKGMQTVGVAKRDWGWDYVDRVELLDGIPYEIQVEIVR